MIEFIKQTETIARREQDFDTSDMIQAFQRNMKIMAENTVRQKMKLKESAFKKANATDDFDAMDSAP